MSYEDLIITVYAPSRVCTQHIVKLKYSIISFLVWLTTLNCTSYVTPNESTVTDKLRKM